MSNKVENLELNGPITEEGVGLLGVEIVYDPEEGKIGPGPHEPRPDTYELIDVDGVLTPVHTEDEWDRQHRPAWGRTPPGAYSFHGFDFGSGVRTADFIKVVMDDLDLGTFRVKDPYEDDEPPRSGGGS